MNTIILKPSRKNNHLEVHFNLWNSDSNNLHFLDIGIMCDNEEQEFFLKIPASKKITVENLSNEVLDIRNSIFNCFVNIDSDKNGYTVLSKQGDKNDEKFILTPEQDTIELDSKNGGVEHHLKIKKIENNKTNGQYIPLQYLRIRIRNLDIEKFLIKKQSPSRIFESSYQENSIIDFRFNDYKLLSLKDAQDLQLQEHKYNKIHFLYMSDYNENICIASSNYKVRFLEHKIWDDYLGLNTERKNEMLVYHLSETEKSNSSFLYKFQKQKTSKSHLLFYAFVVVDLAILANTLFTLFPIKKENGNINWLCFVLILVVGVVAPFIIGLLSKIHRK